MGNAESQYKGYIKENKMNAAMTEFAVKIVSQVVPEHKHFTLTNRFGEEPTYKWTFDEQDIMSKIGEAFHNKYGGSWECIAGLDVSYGVQPRPTNFIRFDIDETGLGDAMNSQRCFCRVIIYQHK